MSICPHNVHIMSTFIVDSGQHSIDPTATLVKLAEKHRQLRKDAKQSAFFHSSHADRFKIFLSIGLRKDKNKNIPGNDQDLDLGLDLDLVKKRKDETVHPRKKRRGRGNIANLRKRWQRKVLRMPRKLSRPRPSNRSKFWT